MFKMRFIFAVFLLGIFVANVSAQKLTRRPYPQNMRSDSVDILWRTDKPSESWVVAHEKGGDHNVAQHSTVPTTAHEMRLPGLKPDTVYEYTVGLSAIEALTPEPYVFHTFPAEKSGRIEFIAYGDHRNYPKDHRAVVEAILEKSAQRDYPLFVIDTGDYTGQGEHKTDFWNDQFFDPARGLIENVPYFTAIGNHESHRKHPRIPFRYLENFSVPTDKSGTEYYYSFRVGDAEFFSIDGYATDYTTGSKQWEWLKAALKDSDAKWKFPFMHYPIYIHRSGPSVSYGKMEIREHLVPLFEKYGVTAVFSGDSHFYQRSEVNGIHYICTGGGGAPLYDPGDGADYIRASAKTHHYAWIALEGDTMKVEAFDEENNLIDSLSTGPRKMAKAPAPVLNFERRAPDKSLSAVETIIIEARDAEGNVNATSQYSEVAMMSSSAKSAATGLTGSGSRFSDNMAADARYTITPSVEAPGTYLLSITVPNSGSVDAPRTLFEIKKPDNDVIRGRVDLSASVAGGKWFDIGLVELAPSSTITFIEAEDEPGRFYADAVKLTRYEPVK